MWLLALTFILLHLRHATAQAINPDKVDFTTVSVWVDLRTCLQAVFQTDFGYGHWDIQDLEGCQTNACLCRGSTLGEAIPNAASLALQYCSNIDDQKSATSILIGYCSQKGYTEIVSPSIVAVTTDAFTVTATTTVFATTTTTATVTGAETVVTVLVATSQLASAASVVQTASLSSSFGVVLLTTTMSSVFAWLIIERRLMSAVGGTQAVPSAIPSTPTTTVSTQVSDFSPTAKIDLSSSEALSSTPTQSETLGATVVTSSGTNLSPSPSTGSSTSTSMGLSTSSAAPPNESPSVSRGLDAGSIVGIVFGILATLTGIISIWVAYQNGPSWMTHFRGGSIAG